MFKYKKEIKNIIFPSIGMRTLKSGLAVATTLFIANLGIISNPLFAIIGTIFAMQQTVKGSLTEGKRRIIGTVLGGTLGYIFATFISNNPITIGIAVIITITLCNASNLSNVITITLTILLSILVGVSEQNPLIYSLFRIWDTSIGLIIGITINYFIAQPKFTKQITEIALDIKDLASIILDKPLNENNEELLKDIKFKMKQLDTLFNYYVADLPFDNNEQTNDIHSLIESCHDIYFHTKSVITLQAEELDSKTINKINNYHIIKLNQSIEIIEKTTD